MSLPLALALLAAAPAQDTVTLAWKFRKGEAIRYDLISTYTYKFAGQEVKQETLFRIRLEPTEVTAEGVAAIEVTFERIKMVREGNSPLDYDSDRDKDPPKDVTLKILAGLMTARLKAKLNPRGAVLEAGGMDDVVDRALKDHEEAVRQAYKSTHGDTWLKLTLEENLMRLPAGPLGKGGTWDDESKSPVGSGDLTTKTRSTLKETRDGGRQAVISQEVTFEGEQGVFTADGGGRQEVVWLVGRGRMGSSKGEAKASLTVGATTFAFTTAGEVRLLEPPKRRRLYK